MISTKKKVKKIKIGAGSQNITWVVGKKYLLGKNIKPLNVTLIVVKNTREYIIVSVLSSKKLKKYKIYAKIIFLINPYFFFLSVRFIDVKYELIVPYLNIAMPLLFSTPKNVWFKV